jgi:hypothetical protein
MKTSLKVLNVLFVAALMVSCGDGNSKSDHHDDNSHTSAHSGTTEEGLQLNDGKKWEMDDHTRLTFGKMVSSFMNADHQSMSGEGLKKAGSDLQGYVAELIKGCTMTGEAHDQLHVYLMGYIPAVDALSESGRLKDAGKVKHYLEIYDDYFE